MFLDMFLEFCCFVLISVEEVCPAMNKFIYYMIYGKVLVILVKHPLQSHVSNSVIQSLII